MDMEKAGPRNKRERGSDVSDLSDQKHRHSSYSTLCLWLFQAYEEPFPPAALQHPLTLTSLALPTSIPLLLSEGNQAALGNGASCWLVQRTIYSTLFSPFSWRTLYHLVPPPPLSSFSSNYYQRQLNLKVRSLEIESLDPPLFPTQRPRGGDITSHWPPRSLPSL